MLQGTTGTFKVSFPLIFPDMTERFYKKQIKKEILLQTTHDLEALKILTVPTVESTLSK